MKAKLILALDQGTTSSRSIVFNEQGKVLANAQQEFKQIFPKPGWVEHKPLDIWNSQLATLKKCLKSASLHIKDIACIGISNQRETSLLWDKRSGEPVCNAVVWQCRRSASICERLKKDGLAELIRKKTGLLIDAYFSATKLMWLLDNIDGLRKRAEAGELLFGTVDSWLIYKLSDGEFHVTDPGNASRTMLFNIHKGCWDEELLKLFNIPQSLLPAVRQSAGEIAHSAKNILDAKVPITGVAGDQQAALFGQRCFQKGDVKNTYGTGCFLLMNTGNQAISSQHKLLTTIAWDLGKGLTYALEGSVFNAGTVIQWLRDQMQIISTAEESEKLALSVPDNGGVYFVPAFTGLGAPYWQGDARGTLLGLTRGTQKAHIVRAALESIAFQSCDLLKTMGEDCSQLPDIIKVDGGATANRFLMQFQADLLGKRVAVAGLAETTALGAAFLAGLGHGIYKNLQTIYKLPATSEEFSCRLKLDIRQNLLHSWYSAVENVMAYANR